MMKYPTEASHGSGANAISTASKYDQVTSDLYSLQERLYELVCILEDRTRKICVSPPEAEQESKDVCVSYDSPIVEEMKHLHFLFSKTESRLLRILNTIQI